MKKAAVILLALLCLLPLAASQAAGLPTLLGAPKGLAPAPAAELPDGVYRILVTDEAGEPVEGVLLQLCDEATCRVLTTDETGCAELDGEGASFSVHVLMAPAGFAKPEDEFLVDEDAPLLTLPLARE